MNKLMTFVSDLHSHTLLCCGAAFLMTACGGGSGDATPTVAASQTTVASPLPDADSDQSSALVTTADFGDDTADSDDPGFTANSVAETGKPLEASLVNAPALQRDPSSHAPSANYHLYVATIGSDTNNGSQDAPFKTINRAAQSARASTIVHVAPGTYYENVRTTANGTGSARIRYVSDTKWGAKIIGGGGEATWRNKGNFTDIVGFDISGSGRLGVENWGSHTLVGANHIHNLSVSNGCSGSGGAGVVNANYKASDGDIIGNVIHDIGVPGSCSGVQGIYSSNRGGKIMNNVVYRVSSYGIHLWHAATDVLVANNTVFANGSARMGGGILIGVGDKPGGVVLNNTRVINNIVYNNPKAGIKQYCYKGQSCIGSSNTTANNLVYGNGSGVIIRKGAATGTINADPQFVFYSPTGAGDYRLKSTSPAVNQGTATAAPSYDIDNSVRMRGAAHDIGAYESY